MGSIGDRIRQVRKERGLAQGELARRVGISQATLSQLENNTSHSTKEIAQFAAVLGVSALWLSNGKGERDVGEPQSSSTEHMPSPRILKLAEALSLLPPEKLKAVSILLGVKL